MSSLQNFLLLIIKQQVNISIASLGTFSRADSFDWVWNWIDEVRQGHLVWCEPDWNKRHEIWQFYTAQYGGNTIVQVLVKMVTQYYAMWAKDLQKLKVFHGSKERQFCQVVQVVVQYVQMEGRKGQLVT